MKVDLKEGVLPISAAASQIARRIKQAQATGTPIIVTQKGYPTGVILSIDSYLKLLELARLGELAVEQTRRQRIVEQANEDYAALRSEEAAS